MNFTILLEISKLYIINYKKMNYIFHFQSTDVINHDNKITIIGEKDLIL